MPRYIAFLRAVNVGGRFVKMAELREALTAAGFDGVETHIQSGNVLVGSRRRSSPSVATELERCLGEWAGFDIPAIVRTPAEVTDLVAVGGRHTVAARRSRGQALPRLRVGFGRRRRRRAAHRLGGTGGARRRPRRGRPRRVHPAVP